MVLEHALALLLTNTAKLAFAHVFQVHLNLKEWFHGP
jgi:hypothetical protein